MALSYGRHYVPPLTVGSTVGSRVRPRVAYWASWWDTTWGSRSGAPTAATTHRNTTKDTPRKGQFEDELKVDGDQEGPYSEPFFMDSLTWGVGARDGWWYPRTVGMLVGCAVGSGAVRVKAPGGMVTGKVTVAVTAAANAPLCEEMTHVRVRVCVV